MKRSGLFLRLCAWILGAFIPLRIRTSWRWYRRARGGRWSRSFDGVRWHARQACPGELHSAILGAGPVPSGVCFDSAYSDVEHPDGHPLNDARACFCEVWS